jgi:hypothetical protein
LSDSLRVRSLLDGAAGRIRQALCRGKKAGTPIDRFAARPFSFGRRGGTHPTGLAQGKKAGTPIVRFAARPRFCCARDASDRPCAGKKGGNTNRPIRCASVLFWTARRDASDRTCAGQKAGAPIARFAARPRFCGAAGRIRRDLRSREKGGGANRPIRRAAVLFWAARRDASDRPCAGKKREKQSPDLPCVRSL